MGSSNNICSEDWGSQTNSLIFSWVSLIVTFIVPIAAISYLYTSIVRSLRCSQSHTSRTFSKKDLSRRKKEDSRITLILASLLVSFAIFVSPNRVIWVLHDHGYFKQFSPDKLSYLKLGADIPYTIHACINPIIYSMVDKTFRETLVFIFYKLTCQKKAAIMVKDKFKKSFSGSTIRTTTNRETSLSMSNKAFDNKGYSTNSLSPASNQHLEIPNLLN